MIEYNARGIGIGFIFQLRGSVIPKACMWAIPNTLACFALHWVWRNWDHPDWACVEGVQSVWSGYTFILGFLISLRNNQAYTRFWESATILNRVRGEWNNAVSNSFAFCTQDPSKQEKVDHFQQLLIRLSSLLFCSALQQVCELKDDRMEIISTEGLDPSYLAFLAEANDRCEIILQWIQRLLVESSRNGVLDAPPPILSRSFQEWSRGIVNLSDLRKVREIQFPFPYAQMVTIMLLVHWTMTPFIVSQTIQSPFWACLVCFLTTLCYWCLIYIAREIDQPFGNDANDLPLHNIQIDFNKSLLALLDPRAQQPPPFDVAKNSVDAPQMVDSGSLVPPTPRGRRASRWVSAEDEEAERDLSSPRSKIASFFNNTSCLGDDSDEKIEATQAASDAEVKGLQQHPDLGVDPSDVNLDTGIAFFGVEPDPPTSQGSTSDPPNRRRAGDEEQSTESPPGSVFGGAPRGAAVGRQTPGPAASRNIGMADKHGSSSNGRGDLQGYSV